VLRRQLGLTKQIHSFRRVRHLCDGPEEPVVLLKLRLPLRPVNGKAVRAELQVLQLAVELAQRANTVIDLGLDFDAELFGEHVMERTLCLLDLVAVVVEADALEVGMQRTDEPA